MITDLQDTGKDTSKSCVFDFPDRPVDTLPPNVPPFPPPPTYPYDPVDDWPEIPHDPPVPGDDPIPGSDPHPVPGGGGSRHTFTMEVSDLVGPFGAGVGMPLGVAMFRQAAITTLRILERVSPIFPIPPAVGGTRFLTFSYRSNTSVGLELFWFLLNVNPTSGPYLGYTFLMCNMPGGNNAPPSGISVPLNSMTNRIGVSPGIQFPSGQAGGGGWMIECDNTVNTVLTDGDINISV